MTKYIEIQQQVVHLAREGRPRRVPAVIETAEMARECFTHIQDLGHEEMWVVGLSNAYRPLGCVMVSRGGVGAVGLTPADLMKPLVGMNATMFVMAHNHPSGDPTPSEADLNLTVQMARAGRVLGIEFLDHLVLSTEGFTSIRGDLGAARAADEPPPIVQALMGLFKRLTEAQSSEDKTDGT